jgi:peptidyl-prolyl cis-trans isomerase D
LRKDTYIVAEKRDVDRINFTDQASAQAARAKIAAGTKFEDVATARGLKPSDISLGTLAQADLGPDQGPVVFGLPLNDVSLPLKGALGGWSLFRVTKIMPGSSKTFEQAAPELKASLLQQLAAAKLGDISNAFEDAHNGGDNVEDAAKKVGMRVIHVPEVDAHGLAPDGTKANVPAAPDFMAQVFKSDVGEEGDPFLSADGHYYVLKVEGMVPQKLKPLDSVRVQATADWIAEQRQKQLADKAQALADEAGKSRSLGPVAAQLHATPQTSPALGRDASNDVLSSAVIAKIFASAPGAAVWGPTTKGGLYVVAVVTGLAQPPSAYMDPNFRQLVTELSSQLDRDFSDGMAAAARAQQGVTKNQQQIDRVLGGEGS